MPDLIGCLPCSRAFKSTSASPIKYATIGKCARSAFSINVSNAALISSSAEPSRATIEILQLNFLRNHRGTSSVYLAIYRCIEGNSCVYRCWPRPAQCSSQSQISAECYSPELCPNSPIFSSLLRRGGIWGRFAPEAVAWIPSLRPTRAVHAAPRRHRWTGVRGGLRRKDYD